MKSTWPDASLAVYRLGRWQASLRFYTARPVADFERPEDLRRFLNEQPTAHCLATQRDFEELQRDGLPLRSVYECSAVVGTEGREFRRQRWGGVVVVTRAAPLTSTANAIPFRQQ